MKAELKKAWIAALLSGKYRQGTGALEKNYPNGRRKSNCCLGVLCRVAKFKAHNEECSSKKTFRMPKETCDTASLTMPALEYFGLTLEQESKLINMNDGIGENAQSFVQIARWIKMNIKTEKSRTKKAS